MTWAFRVFGDVKEDISAGVACHNIAFVRRYFGETAPPTLPANEKSSLADPNSSPQLLEVCCCSQRSWLPQSFVHALVPTPLQPGPQRSRHGFAVS